MTKDSDSPGYSMEGYDDVEGAGQHAPLPRSSVVKGARGQAPRKVARKITTLTLTSRTCKWPIGDPATPDFHYCGEPPQIGRPYCSMHGSMSYQTPQRKRPS